MSTPSQEPAPRPTAVVVRSSLRRAPRYGRFALAGVLLGAVLAALSTLFVPPGAIVGRDAIFILVFLGLGSAGALIGCFLAVLADRRSRPGASNHRPGASNHRRVP